MKRIALLVALTFAAAAWAQEQKPAPKAPEKMEQKEAEKKEPTRIARKPNPKRQEDARHCLEKATNTEIIKCAEEYL